MRKRYEQMNKKEVRILVSRVKRLYDCKVTLSNHAKERMKERNIKEKDVYRVFRNFNIIEFNVKTQGGITALIRGRDKGNQICLSIDLSTGSILTVYKNSFKDNHANVNPDLYNANINIDSFLRYYRINRNIRKLKIC